MTLFVILIVAMRTVTNEKYACCRCERHINSFRPIFPIVSSGIPPLQEMERRWCTRVDKNLPRWPMSVECVPSSGSTSRVSRCDSRQNKMTIDIPRTPSLVVFLATMEFGRVKNLAKFLIRTRWSICSIVHPTSLIRLLKSIKKIP